MLDTLVVMRDWIYEYGRVFLDYLHIIFDNAFYVVLFLTFLVTVVYILIGLVMVFSKKKTKHFKFDESRYPTVTIQIPTYNELAAINCAKKCLEFDYPKDKFDIIIGDDSNKKSISKRFFEFASKHPQVQVTRRGKNIGFKPGNLNNMLKSTKGDYIVIFDSDFLPDNDFLKKMVQPVIKDPSLGGVQARWKVINPNQNIATILGTGIVDTFHRLILPFVTKFSKTVVFCGSAELIKKETLLKLGGWTSGVLTEDIDYSMRMISAGYNVHYLKEVECYCEVPQTNLDLFKQQKRWGYGVIRALINHSKSVFSNKEIGLGKKAMIVLFSSGYLFTSGIFLLTLFGLLSIVTHRPESIQWGLFLTETFRNIILTSGLLIITLFAYAMAKHSKLNLGKFLVGTFTVGLVLVLYVVQGIYKAVFNLPMQWFMLKKNGNDLA